MAGQQRTSSITLDDAAYQRALKEEVAQLRLRTEADLLRLAHKAARNMRQLAPVDTGRLRNSIGVTAGRDGRGPYVDVGPTVDYALPVEFGTRYQEAQPFVRPGLLEAIRDGL